MKYTTGMDRELFEKICDQYAETDLSLKDVTKLFNTSRDTFRRFRETSPDYCARYARAVLEKHENELDELRALEKEMLRAVQTAEPGTAGAVATAYKQMIDDLKWKLARFAPGKYGDKLDLTSKGDKVQSAPLMVVCSNQETAGILERMAHGEQPAASPSQDS